MGTLVFYYLKLSDQVIGWTVSSNKALGKEELLSSTKFTSNAIIHEELAMDMKQVGGKGGYC